MAFGLLKRPTSSSATSSYDKTSFKHTQQHSQPIDVTECTTDRDDDDSGLIIEEAAAVSPEIMELQHDLKAKTAQVSVLRDTLSNLSNQFRTQTKSLEESHDTIRDRDAQISRLDATVSQLQAKAQQQKRQAASTDVEWREKLNDLERILQRAIEERDQWKIRFEELQFDQEDHLLGKNTATPQRNCLWSDDDDNDEQKLLRQSVDDNDSIWNEPNDEGAAALDTAIRPPAFTNRPRPFRRKKNRPAVKPFEIKPMEWVTTTTSSSGGENESKQQEQQPQPDVDVGGLSDNDQEIYLAVPDDAVSRQSKAMSERSDAKARARRVRKTAKQMSIRAGFDCQKLEC